MSDISDATYRGILVGWLQVMYSYLREHGAVKGDDLTDYMKGFKDGIEYAKEKFEDAMQKEMLRRTEDIILHGVKVERTVLINGVEEGEDA